MQITNSELNQLVAHMLGEPDAPKPVDYFGDKDHGARFIAWARARPEIQTLPLDLDWVFNDLKRNQGEVSALYWACHVTRVQSKT